MFCGETDRGQDGGRSKGVPIGSPTALISGISSISCGTIRSTGSVLTVQLHSSRVDTLKFSFRWLASCAWTGESHLLAIKGSSLYVWGLNNNGQGGGGTSARHQPITQVKFPSSGRVVDAVGGFQHSYALTCQ